MCVCLCVCECVFVFVHAFEVNNCIWTDFVQLVSAICLQFFMLTNN